MGTDIYLHAERRQNGIWEYCGELLELEIRHYEFFAILANVRNPVRSVTPYDSIAAPRGLPTDMSKELLADGLLHSGHDAGWLTLRELLEFNWDGKSIPRTAVVDPAIAPLFGSGTGPFPKGQIQGAYSLAEDGPGTRVSWIDTYRDAVGSVFLTDLFETLSRFGLPDDVRIVFSFDT